MKIISHQKFGFSMQFNHRNVIWNGLLLCSPGWCTIVWFGNYNSNLLTKQAKSNSTI